MFPCLNVKSHNNILWAVIVLRSVHLGVETASGHLHWVVSIYLVIS